MCGVVTRRTSLVRSLLQGHDLVGGQVVADVNELLHLWTQDDRGAGRRWDVTVWARCHEFP